MARTEAEIQRLREEIGEFTWFHSIDLGDGIITPGRKSLSLLESQSDAVFRPLDLTGRSVLDVGAWNGGQTVAAVRRGAAKVMAIDESAWLNRRWRGKESFEFVMRTLGLNVPTKIVDVQTLSPDDVGEWDIVLLLGVFYHLFDPITAVQRLFRITKEVLVLETHLDGLAIQRPAMIFYPGNELNKDPTNWWGPNWACVEQLLRCVGFERVDSAPFPAPPGAHRGIFHAWKTEEIYRKHSENVQQSATRNVPPADPPNAGDLPIMTPIPASQKPKRKRRRV